MAVATGHGLHIDDQGVGDAVLLLHSSGLSGRQWRRLVPELVGRGMRAVVPDLTGHGRSEPWAEPTPFSFRTDVDRVSETLRRLGGAHVVGHSYGGLVGLHAALAVPEAVRSLTLYEPVAFGVLDSPRDADARGTLAAVDVRWGVSAGEHEAWLERFVEYWGGSGAWRALREEARQEFRRVGWVLREGVRSLTEDTTPGATFAAVTAPTRLFTGERSPVAGQRVVRRLGEAIGSARVTTIPGVGHMGPVAAPEIVNPLFLDAITPRAGVDAEAP
jgi:pimeloyl-ACP methyl ester carboxylesterase